MSYYIFLREEGRDPVVRHCSNKYFETREMFFTIIQTIITNFSKSNMKLLSIEVKDDDAQISANNSNNELTNIHLIIQEVQI